MDQKSLGSEITMSCPYIYWKGRWLWSFRL